jgi:hypothetical protein
MLKAATNPRIREVFIIVSLLKTTISTGAS